MSRIWLLSMGIIVIVWGLLNLVPVGGVTWLRNYDGLVLGVLQGNALFGYFHILLGLLLAGWWWLFRRRPNLARTGVRILAVVVSLTVILGFLSVDQSIVGLLRTNFWTNFLQMLMALVLFKAGYFTAMPTLTSEYYISPLADKPTTR